MSLAGKRLMSIESIAMVANADASRARAYATILVARGALVWDGADHVRKGKKWAEWESSDSRSRPKGAGGSGDEATMDSMRRRLSAEIKRLREARGWTQNELARRAGINHVLIVRSDKWARPPSAIATALIAQALGVPLGELFGLGASLARE
jgi:DNA-binding XRE family transcriptional regulator